MVNSTIYAKCIQCFQKRKAEDGTGARIATQEKAEPRTCRSLLNAPQPNCSSSQTFSQTFDVDKDDS